jgi:DMSO/TMAO reductase YedYZ molybdopterin-dependent catalytic subunit
MNDEIHAAPEAASEDDRARVPDSTQPGEPEAPLNSLTNGQILSADAEQQMRRMSRRSFLWSAVAVAGTYGGVRWIASRRPEEGIPWPLRRVLQTNEQLARDFYSNTRLAPTFAASRIEPARFNGDIGLGNDFDASQWQLEVQGAPGDEVPMLSLAQIKKLPRFEMITELKCIEGWSNIVHWGGARLRDFIARYPPATQSGEPFNLKKPEDMPSYVGLATPDGGYYVGLEMEAALHPQTLLCYEMNGKPLTPEHGAPLRLAIPVKYGIKNIKRIGTLTYTNGRPADYWAEQGYDYYAGL